MKRAFRRLIVVSAFSMTGILVIVFLFLLYPQTQKVTLEKQIAKNEIAALQLAEKRRSLLMQNRQSQAFVLPILLYHYVENVTDEQDTIRKSLSISPQIFEAQVQTLLTNGYTPITLEALSDYFDGRGELPQKPVILSFDDGYRDFYTDVLPVLSRYRIKAVLYMVSGFTDFTKNYLTAAQLREISQSGLVEIDAHSVSHVNLTLLDLSQAEKVMTESKQQLETFLGKKVHHFAFPYGAFSSELLPLVEKAGYKTAATVEVGIEQSYAGRFTLRRIRPGENSGEAFLDRIHAYQNEAH